VVAVVLATLALGGCDDVEDDSAGPTPGTMAPAPQNDGEATTAAGDDPASTGADEDVRATERPGDDVAVADVDEDAASSEGDGPTVVDGVAPTMAPRDITGEAEARRLVEPALEAQVEALTTPDGASEDLLATVADGAALGAVRAQALEYVENGWTQVGAPRVVSAEVASVDAEADPPTVQVLVCLDHSDVDVLDAEGVSMVDASADARVLQLWTLEEQDGRWTLVQQGFTDETRC
jgi:hypothetical protein